jgi:hypothetical protein
MQPHETEFINSIRHVNAAIELSPTDIKKRLYAAIDRAGIKPPR